MNDHIAVRIKYFKKHATHFFHAKILALCDIVCQCVSLGNYKYDIYSQKNIHSYLRMHHLDLWHHRFYCGIGLNSCAVSADYSPW